MKDKTYDIPGIHFGLATIKNHEDLVYIDRRLEICNNEEELKRVFMKYILDVSTFIDFDNFDGLTFKELFQFDVFNKDYLFFIIYGQIKYRDYSINNCIYVETIKRNKIDDINQNIDTYISNYLMDIYDKRNIRIQKFIKSYLERYKYSYNEVDKVLKNYKLKNQNRK